MVAVAQQQGHAQALQAAEAAAAVSLAALGCLTVAQRKSLAP
jgi:hypothetical protein